MVKQENVELFKRFSEEFKALREDPQPVILEMSKIEAWMLMAEVQLALRHPNNKGSSSKYSKAVVERLASQIVTTPALIEVYRRGWEPKYDDG
jgi:hypothetical protein